MTDDLFYPLRYDLQLTQVNYEGKEFVIIDDPNEYADIQITISLEFLWLLTQIEQPSNLDLLAKKLEIENVELLQPFVIEYKKLDEYNLIDSPSFQKIKEEKDKEFLSHPIRSSVLADHSFPFNREEFNNSMKLLFNTTDINDFDGNSTAAIIPHLDLITGLETQKLYSSAYHSMKNADFDTIVIFGTAHYQASHRFMLSQKKFETPLGYIDVDLDLLNKIKDFDENCFLIDEYAHRPEHSIEIQVALSSYYFSNKKFKILPVLVAGYFDFMDLKKSPNDDDTINSFIFNLKKSINLLGRKALYIASVDLSHIGRKFQDDFDALDKMPIVKEIDMKLIDAIKLKDFNAFYNLINQEQDQYRVCGTAPIFTFLKTIELNNSKLNGYNFWYEEITKSAVSCSSINFV